MEELQTRLHAGGRRLTQPRRRVLAAVCEHPHSTPEQIVGHVGADGGTTLTPSTVYRALATLQELDLVAHTHLDHHAPTYHVADHPDHVHLVCRGCGATQECAPDAAASFVASVLADHGFEADMTHMAVHGRCARCR